MVKEKIVLVSFIKKYLYICPMSYRDKEINKRASRHVAFMSRFAPGFYILVGQTRALIRGLIDDHERHPAFNIHHRINNRKVAYPTLEVVYLNNERSKI